MKGPPWILLAFAQVSLPNFRYLVLSANKYEAKKAMESKKPHSVLVMNETPRASTMILTLSNYGFQLSAAAQTKL